MSSFSLGILSLTTASKIDSSLDQPFEVCLRAQHNNNRIKRQVSSDVMVHAYSIKVLITGAPTPSMADAEGWKFFISESSPALSNQLLIKKT